MNTIEVTVNEVTYTVDFVGESVPAQTGGYADSWCDDESWLEVRCVWNDEGENVMGRLSAEEFEDIESECWKAL